MTYNVGEHVNLAHINRKVDATFQDVLETTKAEDRPQFTFTKEGKMVRQIPVIAL